MYMYVKKRVPFRPCAQTARRRQLKYFDKSSKQTYKMKVVLLCAAAAAMVVDAMNTCGCEARALGFTIDCTAAAVMDQQYNILQDCPSNSTCSVSLVHALATTRFEWRALVTRKRPLSQAQLLVQSRHFRACNARESAQHE
jgi:hypothetical protein